MQNCAIVGVNWGDEGKGRMVDYLAAQYDAVIRYQGGNNAGHTVVNDQGFFALHLLPSGIFHPDKVNLLGPGTVINLEKLVEEIETVRAGGVAITPDNLKISDRAIMVLPFHPAQDGWEEKRLGKDHFGSTLRGISPVYGDKAMKKALQMGDLRYPDALKAHLKRLIDWKNALVVPGYGEKPISFDETYAWIEKFGAALLPHLCDAHALLSGMQSAGRSMLFEAQLGALRDLDYGIYPFTSSSSPLAAYAPLGSGLPTAKIERVVGAVKAYSTCVGVGPFVGELTGAEADRLRDLGKEFGAATGRPRRVAWLDLPATKYGAQLQGATEIAFTKLDILSAFDEIPVCVAYKLRGETIERFPYTPDLDECEPVYRVFKGWKTDISGARTYNELPREAREYVEFAEKYLECPIRYVSVGAERESLIDRGTR